ncbi:moonshiner [Drosophila montana]|uniref:moonshiner n=1 Tax=Drosophila montana TaxID=40370 RepID=UPI00313DBEED
MPRRKNNKIDIKPSWIADSCNFFTHVITDTLENLRKSSISRTEKMALDKLETQWMQHYMPSNHMPESNPCPLPVPKPKPRRPTAKPTAKAAGKANPVEQSVDPHTLDDHVNIVYRICIPPLKPHWQCRSFDLSIPAYVCKDNLIDQLINWQLLDRIMELPQEEATAMFQKYVKKLLLLQQVD